MYDDVIRMREEISQQLKTVMRRIEQISGVMRVTRPAG